MNIIKIINPGFLTTIQDNGRIGYQQFGVPISGAMDLYSLQLANILVDNEKNEACLEMTMIGSQIEFYNDTAIAITGANMNPEINFIKINMYETIYVKKGDVLRMSGAKDGARAYLSISGGFDIPKVLGSKSTYLRGKIGGYKGRKIERDDEIKIKEINQLIQKRSIPKYLIPEYKHSQNIGVIFGPEDESFTKEGIKTFLNSEYIISNKFDRMGYKLEGPSINHKEKPDIISMGITLGTIQVPGNGKPMIMLSDKQTTGGYTRIANVITTDIPKLGQLKAGDKIRFYEVDLTDAQGLLKEKEDEIDNLIKLFDEEKKAEVRCFLIKVNGVNYDVSIKEIK